ncbi:Portal protein [Cupriavidus sp. H19C3]|uniref:portal protein n=1 Tax=Cupriavidus sp. H19C3 TaxID=3241603 RepID=UPI003BF7E58F
MAEADLARPADDQYGPTADVYALCRWFEEAENETYEARQLSERDRDYYDNDQWTREELAILRKRKQPALTINYIKRKVEFLRGYERRQRSDPKAYPRTPQHADMADAATDSLRFVADQNDFDEIRSQVYENLLIEGYGGADVIVEQHPSGVDVSIQYVPWDRLFYDPHSRKPDFSDAKYKGIVIWTDKSDALDTYPDRADAIEATLAGVSISDTYDDRPRFMWCDNRRSRVRIVQIHWQEGGEWWVCTFTKGGILVDPQRSPYVDEYGRPACSLIMRSAYIDRENNRYGSVRDLISLQDEINKRRSKALHLINMRQVMGERGAVDDVNKAKQELAKPDGYIETNPGLKFEVLQTQDMAAGNLQMLQQATGEMQASGPNAALAGKDPRDQSGRAIQAQQQGGAVEIEPQMDSLRQWTRDIYQAVWLRVRQFWTDEKWVRVTDSDRNMKWVGLNHPVTLKEALGEMDPQEAEQIVQQMGLQPGDPRLEQVVRVDNDISGLDVDIIIEEGPDVVTIQAEQFAQLADLASKGLPIPPDAIIEASSLRNKETILKEMRGEGKKSPQVQQLEAQLQELGEKYNDLQAQNDDNAAKNQVAQYEAETGRYDAETKRLTATAPGMTPEQIVMLASQVFMEAMQNAGIGMQAAPPPPPPPEAMPPGIEQMQPNPPTEAGFLLPQESAGLPPGPAAGDSGVGLPPG